MAWADQVGMNIHPTGYARYANSTAIISRLNWLGVKWVRIDAPSGTATYSMYKAAGFSVLLVCSTAAQANAALAGGYADAIECHNEPNGPAGGNVTAAVARSDGLAVISAVAGRVPTISSALADPDTTYAQAVGDVGAGSGAVHIYRANRQGATYASWRASNYTSLPYMAPNKDYWITEFGSHDGLFIPPPGHTPTSQYTASEQIAADMALLLADNPAGTTGSCKKIFWYELQGSTSTDYQSDTNIQHYFGMFYPDGTPKMHAFQLRELLYS